MAWSRRTTAAIILPIDDGRVWLVEQFRYTIQERALELPQGGWEMEIENPEELARGELREEMGLDAAEMTLLGTLWIAYGFTRQKQHVFLATGLTPTRERSRPRGARPGGAFRSGRGVRADDARRHDPRQLHPCRLGALSDVEGAPRVAGVMLQAPERREPECSLAR